MADNKDGFIEHVSTGSGPSDQVDQQRRSGRFKHHCTRFWWLYALLVAVLVLVIVLPM
jgi:hypothetical protein